MSISDEGGGFDAGGFDGGCHDAPLVDPLAAAWVDRNLRGPTTETAEPFGRLGPRRNDPCPCSSGKKFKHCCIGTVPPTRRSRHLAMVAMLVGSLIAVFLIAGLIWR